MRSAKSSGCGVCRECVWPLGTKYGALNSEPTSLLNVRLDICLPRRGCHACPEWCTIGAREVLWTPQMSFFEVPLETEQCVPCVCGACVSMLCSEHTSMGFSRFFLNRACPKKGCRILASSWEPIGVMPSYLDWVRINLWAAPGSLILSPQAGLFMKRHCRDSEGSVRGKQAHCGAHRLGGCMIRHCSAGHCGT